MSLAYAMLQNGLDPIALEALEHRRLGRALRPKCGAPQCYRGECGTPWSFVGWKTEIIQGNPEDVAR